MPASYDNLFSVDRACNTVCDNILDPRMLFLMFEFLLSCLGYNRICDRMRIMLFKTCCQSQHLLLILSSESNDFCHLRRCMSQGTGLVKNDRIRLGDRLHELPALYGNIASSGFAHSRQHGKRHSQLECTRIIHHQN